MPSIFQFTGWTLTGAGFYEMEDLGNISVSGESLKMDEQNSKHIQLQEEESPDVAGSKAIEDIEENQDNVKAEGTSKEACEEKVHRGVDELDSTEDGSEQEEKEVNEEREDDSKVHEKDRGEDYLDHSEKEKESLIIEEKQEKEAQEPKVKTEMKEDEKDIKEKVKKKAELPGRKSDGVSCATLRTQSKSSMPSRSARPSTRRDAMAKFQKEETPGVSNFKVQRMSIGMSGGASVKQKILNWCKSKTQKYEGVSIENFSSSWSDGLAFCALVHRFFPSEFDFSSLKASEREKNFTLAFSKAEVLADCCPLLEVSDMLLMGKNPDPLCVFTYVQALCHHLSKIEKERREKGSMEEEKKKEDDQNAPEANNKEEDKKENCKQIEEDSEKGLDCTLNKTDQETDQNENLIDTCVPEEKQGS